MQLESPIYCKRTIDTFKTEMNKTKTIATLGPATQSEKKIVKLNQAGLTSHTAIVGREPNIPVVCNVLDATSLFKNGQTITIDGSTGHISCGSVSSR